ncbi:NAD(P)-dependent oxidoreductase [Microbacterium sp. RD1]|uniref:NAD(P)-dependent oxidoreductase n=1 Tax=Microbacterium sp. RD1 TaxID=3457313 RepID=UPI003FA58079
MTTERIGFIGLGNMGAPIAMNLLRDGRDVSVFDISRDAAAPHLAAGARWADSPASAAADADLLITMLPGPRQVEDVLLRHGAAAALRPGAVWVDMSTSSPETAQLVAETALDSRGVHRLDAPVSGMVRGATEGTLQIFVGGDGEIVERVRPVFNVLGRPETVFHMGPHGAGYVTKIVGNQLWFSHLVATAEVLTLGAKAGVDVELLRKTIAASPSNSTLIEKDIVCVYEGDYDESFAVSLAAKDSGLAVSLGRELGVSVELSALVEQIYRRAALTYGPRAGEMSPVKLYEDLAGIKLRPGHAS